VPLRERQRTERDSSGRPYDPWDVVLGDEEADRLRHTYEQTGRHAGRGPKAYRRSDERITEDVCDRLTQHPHIDATDIAVTVQTPRTSIKDTGLQRGELLRSLLG
jgi:hypothetical protein